MTDLVTAAHIRDAVDEVLHQWLPTALAHVAYAGGVERPHYPRSWHHVASVQTLLQPDQLPAVVVDVQLTGQDRRASEWDHTFTVSVTAVTRGATTAETLTINDLYRTAFELALRREPSLGGLVEAPVFRDETLSPELDAQRTVLAGWRRWTYTRRDALPDLADLWAAPPITEHDPAADYAPPGIRRVAGAGASVIPRSDP